MHLSVSCMSVLAYCSTGQCLVDIVIECDGNGVMYYISVPPSETLKTFSVNSDICRTRSEKFEHVLLHQWPLCVSISGTATGISPFHQKVFFLPNFLPSSFIQLNSFACDNFLRMFSDQISSHEEVIKIVKRRDDRHTECFLLATKESPVKSWFTGPRRNKW